ncbi:hypothetical protein O7602_26370 [Micromonospora sp. WMMD1128]|uniref:hypothetical protein n=1 Tax=unclassified Micromonospora TaxID=2617518 RepID=UPI00248A9083|nr:MULTISPECIES: hypothetical protein [unclassified Micromonospora]WBB73174.1 hypothetical protein O7602_26370 [Micromonospora sp. WMMD1128]WFE33372.1 hypothetical protein O7613_28265 [Micromonospora sp. WMMD975]
MKRRILSALTLATVGLAGAAVAPTPASASDAPGFVCNLTQNTWLRDQPHGGVLRTLTAGRGFRAHGGWAEDNDAWVYGHGAEYPSIDGWVPLGNTTC